MSTRVWEDNYDGSVFYVYPDGVDASGHNRAFPPRGWRYRVEMHDHTGEAYDKATGEEWTVRPPEGWWDDLNLIASSVMEDA